MFPSVLSIAFMANAWEAETRIHKFLDSSQSMKEMEEADLQEMDCMKTEDPKMPARCEEGTKVTGEACFAWDDNECLKNNGQLLSIKEMFVDTSEFLQFGDKSVFIGKHRGTGSAADVFNAWMRIKKKIGGQFTYIFVGILKRSRKEGTEKHPSLLEEMKRDIDSGLIRKRNEVRNVGKTIATVNENETDPVYHPTSLLLKALGHDLVYYLKKPLQMPLSIVLTLVSQMTDTFEDMHLKMELVQQDFADRNVLTSDHSYPPLPSNESGPDQKPLDPRFYMIDFGRLAPASPPRIIIEWFNLLSLVCGLIHGPICPPEFHIYGPGYYTFDQLLGKRNPEGSKSYHDGSHLVEEMRQFCKKPGKIESINGSSLYFELCTFLVESLDKKHKLFDEFLTGHSYNEPSKNLSPRFVQVFKEFVNEWRDMIKNKLKEIDQPISIEKAWKGYVEEIQTKSPTKFAVINGSLSHGPWFTNDSIRRKVIQAYQEVDSWWWCHQFCAKYDKIPKCKYYEYKEEIKNCIMKEESREEPPANKPKVVPRRSPRKLK